MTWLRGAAGSPCAAPRGLTASSRVPLSLNALPRPGLVGLSGPAIQRGSSACPFPETVRACRVVDVYVQRLVSVTESFVLKRPDRRGEPGGSPNTRQYMEETLRRRL